MCDPQQPHQGYSWTPEWQREEAEAAAELDSGQGRVFPDPAEAVRWLRSPED